MKKLLFLAIFLSPLLVFAQPCATWGTVTSTNVSCNGGTDGSIAATASATASPITYTLNPGNISNTTGVFNNLLAMGYTITASDANNCSVTSMLTITEPTALNFTNVSTTNVLCNGAANGTINVTTTGGTGAHTLTLMPSNINIPSPGSFVALPAGTYTIVATDANNCTASTVVTVTQPPALTILNVNTTAPSCVPGGDGIACITAIGGIAAYQYSMGFAQPQASNCFTNLGAGNYTVTVTDANGCTDVSAVAIVPPSAPTISSVILANSNPCDPDTVNMTATGGTAPLSYGLMPGNITNGNGQFILSTPGIYTITALDINGCSVSTNVNSSNSSASVSLTSSNVTNPQCGQSNGSINATVNWGSNTFNYILNPGNITNSTGNFTNLGIGTYTLSVQNTSCAINVFVDSFTLVSALNPYPIVATQNTFTATVPTNGTAPYAYTLNGQSIPSPQSAMRCTGVDTFRITDAGGCSFDTTFNFVAANAFPSISLNKNITDASCALTNDGQIIFAPSAPLSFDWIANASVLGSTANSLSNLTPDNYVVKITDASNNCIQDTSVVGALGTNCGNISGVAYNDTNMNCINDIEPPLSNVTVTLMPGNLQAITNASGAYQFLGLPFGNYTVSVDTNFVLGLYPSCNQIQYDTLNASSTSIVNDFPHNYVASGDIYTYTYSQNKVPASPARSLGRRQSIYFGHNGSILTPINVNLYALMDSIHHYDTASLAPTTIVGDTIMWTINSIGPWQAIFIYYDSIQSLPMNHVMPFKVWIEPNNMIVAGNALANDTSCAYLPIATAYDPNDKQVSPPGLGTPGYIPETQKELSYQVRFQNTGNAMAYNVFIEDTISNYLDINSIQVLGASHPYLIEKENNLLRFRFNNIMLPDSNADEPNSHGYIQYSIQQDAGNQKGDVINNTAHIYFDFNPAIVTNTTVNTIGIPVGVENIIRSARFAIYPNPTKETVYVQALAHQKIENIALMDIMGRGVAIESTKVSADKMSFSMKNFTPGIYLLQLNGESFKILKE